MTNVLDVPKSSGTAKLSILREEMVVTDKSLKLGKSAIVDNIAPEIIKAGSDPAMDILQQIRTKC